MTGPSLISGDELVERVAEALANQIGMRNGAPPIRGCLHLMPQEMAAKFRDDARAALEASGLTALREDVARLRAVSRILLELRKTIHPLTAQGEDRIWRAAEKACKLIDEAESALTNRSSHDAE